SANPTPTDPIGLKLAAADKNSNILYIARPCQYSDLESKNNCQNKFWSNARLSEVVIDSVNEAITQYTAKYNIRKINLYGYSGGAAVGGLVATHRKEVKSSATSAGDLDHNTLASLHQVSPRDESLKPIDFADQVKQSTQLHSAGEQDRI